MRTVLFIAYHYPPMGGAGVQRAVKFVRYLPEYGFRPVVVTGPGPTEGRWYPADATMAAEVSASVPVFRAPAPERDVTGDGGRMRRLLGRPHPFGGWWKPAVLAAGGRAAAEHPPDAILVTLGPWEGLDPALELGRRLGVPVVADLRDPWALDEVQVYPSRWHRNREVALMRRQLGRADFVVMNTPEAARAVMNEFPEIPKSRVGCVPNGYDAADFAGLAPRQPDGRFRIVHSGYLHTDSGLAYARSRRWRKFTGGALFDVDMSGRSHVFLMRAIERLAAESPGILDRVELRLVGRTSPSDEAVVRGSSAGRCVTLPGYVDHLTSVRELVEADLLFLPLHGLKAGARARVVPGKTYEYLASGRPILAALPDGDARDLVNATGAGVVVRPDDVAAMAAAIREQMAAAPAPLRPLSEEIMQFERRNLTRDLAGYLEGVLRARSGAVAGVTS